MKLAICTMIRNESRNYLPALLLAWQEFADEIILLDNNDADDNADVELFDEVWQKPFHYEWRKEEAWGNEAPAREQLFNLAMKSDADWLLWLDADMCPLRDPKPLMQPGIDAVAFPLYDLWSTTPLAYREDSYWKAHHCPRIWAIRKPSVDFIPEWATQGLHCGHLPLNLMPIRVLTAPNKYAILHYGYASSFDRMRKWRAYMDQSEILSPFQLAHAQTITDHDPNIIALPYAPKWEIKK